MSVVPAEPAPAIIKSGAGIQTFFVVQFAIRIPKFEIAFPR